MTINDIEKWMDQADDISRLPLTRSEIRSIQQTGWVQGMREAAEKLIKLGYWIAPVEIQREFLNSEHEQPTQK